MKWIVRILSIEPYCITCLWNNNEIRTIDLTNFIKEKSLNPENSYSQLKDIDRFYEAKCDGSTIFWANGLKMIDYDGQEKLGDLDIDPHFLYELSHQDVLEVKSEE
ncbi:MAG: DUF2442 domain-containing protein [Bacteroidales bacterium]|nr:DUF2442 domain-containing protein [Bacteroidales bacterium]